MIPVLISLGGCASAPKKNEKINFRPEHCAEIEKTVTFISAQCLNLKNKKIFTHIKTSIDSPVFLEGFNHYHKALHSKAEFISAAYGIKFNSYSKAPHYVEYQGQIGKYIKEELDDYLTCNCQCIMVTEKSYADIILEANVRKFYSQVLSYEENDKIPNTLDENFEKGSKMIIASILNIDNTINSKKWDYQHLLKLTTERYTTKINTTREGVTRYHDTLEATKECLLYDNQRKIASKSATKSISTWENDALKVVDLFAIIIVQAPITPLIEQNNFKVDLDGHIDVFDINNGKIQKTIQINNKNKAEVTNKLLFSQSGNLKLLIYDYIKKVVQILQYQ
jgi:hypothetical protein